MLFVEQSGYDRIAAFTDIRPVMPFLKIRNNPFLFGQLVMLKLSTKTANPILERDRIRNVGDTLFPTHPERIDEVKEERMHDIQLFSEDELSKATNSLQNRKAFGPDGIPVESLKADERRVKFVQQIA